MTEAFPCPFCGEPCELADADELQEGTHVLVQDCDVCCKPVQLRIEVRGGVLEVKVEG